MTQTPPEDLAVPGGQEAGLAFRAEMAVQNFFMGYWRHLAVIVGVGLVGVLVYGQYSSWNTNRQRAASAQIAQIESDLRDALVEKLDPMARSLLVDSGYDLGTAIYLVDQMPPEQQSQIAMMSPGASRFFMMFGALDPAAQTALLTSMDGVDAVLLFLGEPDDAARADMTAHADKLVALAGEGSGASSTEALLEAAEIYRRAGAVEPRRAALQAASGGAKAGILHHAAETGLAHVEIEAGQPDQAITRLQALVAAEEGFLAQDATMELAQAYDDSGKPEEAAKLYDDFLVKWPDSPRAEEVKRRRAAPAKEG